MRLRFSSLMLAGSAMFALASAAHAQDNAPAQDASTAQEPPGEVSQVAAVNSGSAAPAEEGDIVVTGQFQAFRGNVTLRELPQATQTISSVVLQEQNITRLDQALDLSASVARQNSFGGFFESFAIRGFQGDPDFASGFLINGFNGSRGYGGTRDASNIETIEVLRGPTSALFGRGEPGGTVNIVTKKPFFGNGGYVSAQVGRFDNYRGEADLNLQIDDVSAFRITGTYEEGDTFRDVPKYSKIFLTPSILLKSGPVTASYELELSRQKVAFDRGVPAINGDPSALPRSRFLGEPNDGRNTSEAMGHTLQLQYNLGNDWRILGGIGYRVTWFDGFGQDPEFGAARNPLLSVAGSQYLARRRIFRDNKTEDFIPRVELSGSTAIAGMEHNLLIGADYEYFKLDAAQTRFRPGTLTAAQLAEFAAGTPSRATLIATNSIDINNPQYFTAAEIASQTMSPFQDRTEVAKAWGVYFRDRIEVTDWLAVQGGIRYDSYEQTVTQRLNANCRTVGAVLQCISDQKFTKWTPSLGVSVDPVEGLTLYGSYSKGFRANTGTNVRNEAFRPETTEAYEVGAKFDPFDGMLTGTIALYKMKKSNLKTADPVNAGFSLDVGKAESKGVEVDITAELPAGFQAILSYAYTDASIAEDILDPDFGRTIRAGDPLIGVPKNSFSGTLSNKIEIGDRELNLGANLRYVGRRLGETGANYFLPKYTLVRLFGSFDLTEQLRLTADVSNLFNKEYFPSSYAALWTMPGAPREWRVRLAYKF